MTDRQQPSPIRAINPREGEAGRVPGGSPGNEEPAEARPETGNGRGGTRLAAYLAVLFVYFALALLLAWTKAPWCDEGWFANPSFNLAYKGHMGSNLVEPSGHFLNVYLSGIRERTYLMTPNHLVGLAAWYRVAGFSLFRMRLYSILWGAVGLMAFVYVVRLLFSDPRVTYVAGLFCAVDFVFLWCAADGRMDAPAAALAFCSLAAYLRFRESRFDLAVLASQCLAALAVFTHPNSAVVILPVFILTLVYDRRKLRFKHALVAACPYLLCAAAWSIYILQSPHDFYVQFLANARGESSVRFRALTLPHRALVAEFVRHIGVYLLDSIWGGRSHFWFTAVLPLYFSGNIWLILSRRNLSQRERKFLLIAAIVLFGMTFLNGFKAYNYMVYLVPFYDTALAAWLVHLYSRDRRGQGIAVLAASAFLILQLSTSVTHIWTDEYRNEYLPVADLLKSYQKEGKSIVATSAFGFALGFEGFTDDWRLGFHSGQKPDVIVLDRSYRDFSTRFARGEPKVFAHYFKLLTTQYKLVQTLGSFWILTKDDSAAPTRPDLASIDLKDPGEAAEELYRKLAPNALP